MDDLEALLALDKINTLIKTDSNVSQTNHYIEDILNLSTAKGQTKLKDITFPSPNHQLRNTIETLYTTISPDALKKIKKNSVETVYKNTLNYYQDFDFEDFVLVQQERKQMIKNTIKELRESKEERPRMLETALEASKLNKSTYVLSRVSGLITLFFTKASKEMLMKEFNALQLELAEKTEERQSIRPNVFKSIESNFEILLMLILSVKEKKERFEFLIELMKCLPYLESKEILFKLFKEFSMEKELMYEDKGVSFFNIGKLFDFNRGIGKKDKNKDNEKSEAVNEAELPKQIVSYFSLPIVNHKTIKVANNARNVYILMSIETESIAPLASEQKLINQKHLILIARSIKDNEIELIKPIALNMTPKHFDKINLIINDESFIWLISCNGKVIDITILHLSSLEVYNKESIELDDEINLIYHDNKRLYCILNEGKRLFSCKLNLLLSHRHYYTLSIQSNNQDQINGNEKESEVLNYKSLQMKDSITINDIIVLQNDKGSKFYSFFSLSKINNETDQTSATAIHHITIIPNSNRSPNTFYSYYSKENKFIKFSSKTLKIKVLSAKKDNMIALPYSYPCGNLLKANDNISNTTTAYELLIHSYAKYIQIAGNFNIIISDDKESYQLLQHNLVLVEYEDFAFILNQMSKAFSNDNHTNDSNDAQLMASYFIIIKQYTNYLFNTNKTSAITSNQDLQKNIETLKQFIIQFIKEFATSTSKCKWSNNHIILTQIKEIEANLNMVFMPSKEMKSLINQSKDPKVKLSLLQLLITKANYSDEELYSLAREIEVEIYTKKTKDYERHYSFINDTLKKVQEAFIHSDFDSYYGMYLNVFYDASREIANKWGADDTTSNKNITGQRILRLHMINNSFTFKALFLVIQKKLIDQVSLHELAPYLPILLNLLIKLQLIDAYISIPSNQNQHSTIYDLWLSCPSDSLQLKMHFNKEQDELIVKHSPNCFNLSAIQYEMNGKDKKDSVEVLMNPSFKNMQTLKIFNQDEKLFYKAQLHSASEYMIPQNDLMNAIENTIVFYIIEKYYREDKEDEETQKTGNQLNKKVMPFYNSKLLQFISLDDTITASNESASSSSSSSSSINLSSILNKLELRHNKETETAIKSLFSTYQSKESIINNAKKSLVSIDYSSPTISSAITNLNKALSMKNMILSSLGGVKIMPVIVKLFSVIVKFHNFNNKFIAFATEITDATSNDQWHTIPNYDIFYSIWSECSQIRIWFSELKSQIPDSSPSQADQQIEDESFDNEILKHLDIISAKTQFINDIIFPSPLEATKFRKESVIKLIDILKSSEFGIEEIKTISKEQNSKAEMKTNQLALINILLSIASKENVLNLILYHLNTLYRPGSKKLVSFVDDLLGADYLAIDKVKNQFHLMMDIIKGKITSESFGSMAKNTQMNLYQSLIWKIKGRDFYIVEKICESGLFNTLKTCQTAFRLGYDINHCNADVVVDEDEIANANSIKVVRIITLSDETLNQRLFELFKLISLQVFKRIKTTSVCQRKDSLSLSRNVSKIVEDDEKKILNYFVSFYCDLSEENVNFKEFLSHLYQCLVNERELCILVINSNPLLLVKIIKVLQCSNNNNSKGAYMKFEVKMLLIKLLYQLLSNIDDMTRVDSDLLLSICNIKEEDKDKDPFEVLFNYIFDLFTVEQHILLKKEYEAIIQMFIVNEIFASYCNAKLVSVISNGNMLQLLSLFNIDSTPYRYGKRILLSSNTTPLILEDTDEKNIKYGYIVSFSSSDNKEDKKKGNKTNIKTNDSMSYYAKSNQDKVYYIEEKQLELQGISTIKETSMSNLLLANEVNKEPIKAFIEANKELIVQEALKILNASFKTTETIGYKDKYLLMKFLYYNLNHLKINNTNDLLKAMSTMMTENYNKDFYFTSLEVLENELLYQIDKPNDMTNSEESRNNKEPKAVYDLLTYTIDIEAKQFIIESKFGTNQYQCDLSNFNTINHSKEDNKTIFTNTVSFYDGNLQKFIWNNNDLGNANNHFVFLEEENENIFQLLLETPEYKSKCKCIITTNLESNKSLSKFKLPIVFLKPSFYYDIVSFLTSLKTNSLKLEQLFLLQYTNTNNNNVSSSTQIEGVISSDIAEDDDANENNIFINNLFLTTIVEPKILAVTLKKENQKECLNKVFEIQNECFKRMIVLITRRMLLKAITLKYITDTQYNSYFITTTTTTTCYNAFDIYRLISDEYYLNATYANASNANIKHLLKGFLNSLSKDKLSIDIINLLFTSNIYSKLNYSSKDTKNSNSAMENQLKLMNGPLESKLIKNTIETPNIIHSIISFILNNIAVFDKANAKAIHFFIANLFNKAIEADKEFKKNGMFPDFIMSIMRKIYDEIINDKPNKSIYIDFMKENNAFRLIGNLINYINIESFWSGNSADSSNKGVVDYIQFIFKYFDVVLWMQINYDINVNETNMRVVSDVLFDKFYYQYHLLALNKNQEPNEMKLSLIQTINGFQLLDQLNGKANANVISTNKSKVIDKEKKVTDMNYQFKLNESIDITLDKSIVFMHSQDKEYNSTKGKLVMYTKDKDNSCSNGNQINIQDIIDCTSAFKGALRSYSQVFPMKSISIAYMNNINTSLYAFGLNYSQSLGINDKLTVDYPTPQQCKGLSASTWNFNYGYYYVIALDDNGTVYSCGANSGAGLKKTSINQFTNRNTINTCDALKNSNIASFACGNSNATIILTKDNKLYGIGNNIKSMLSDAIKDKSKEPILIHQPQVQSRIIQISLSFHNAFAITEDGKGYAIGSNEKNQIDETNTEVYFNWIEFKLSENLKGFVSSVCGEQFYLFLIQSNEGSVDLYSSGKNDNKTAGISTVKTTHFNQCDYPKGTQFKTIATRNTACAAITKTGLLYIWGKGYFQRNNTISTINYPKCVDTPVNCIIDDVSISLSHMIVLARIKQDNDNLNSDTTNQYVRRVFSAGKNTHGALGISMEKADLNEVPFFSLPKFTPVKIATGYDCSYVLTVDAKDIMNQLNSNVVINTNVNEANHINVSLSYPSFGSDHNNALVSYYQSSSFSELEEYINQLSQNVIQEFYDIMEDIRFSQNIPINQVTYDSFKKEIANPNKDHLKLKHIFNSKTVSENILNVLFTYLSTKIHLTNTVMVTFSNKNKQLEDKAFLNKAIKPNLHFLSSETRIKNFNETLTELRKKRKSKRSCIKVNRFQASEFYEKNIVDFELKETIFGQIYQGLHKIEKECYYMYELDRLFSVEFIREGATDQGGPYHDVFSAIADEVQSKSLDLFIKSPNNRVNIGILRDKYVINPDAVLDNQMKAYEFLGKLFVCCIFSSECLNLNIHPIIWKLLFGTKLNFNDIESIDYLFYKLITDLENSQCSTNDEFNKQFDLCFTIQNSAGKEIELKDKGAEIKVTLNNKGEFITLAKQRRTEEFDFQIQFIKKGIIDLIDESQMEILTWREIDELICGKPKLDLVLLKKRTSYSGYKENDNMMTWFWETLEEFTEQERVMYLKFVWGRSRLPNESCGFTHTVAKSGYRENCDTDLPKSSTCFCKLQLPKYSSKTVLQNKLKYVIMNCNEIDADY